MVMTPRSPNVFDTTDRGAIGRGLSAIGNTAVNYDLQKKSIERRRWIATEGGKAQSDLWSIAGSFEDDVEAGKYENFEAFQDAFETAYEDHLSNLHEQLVPEIEPQLYKIRSITTEQIKKAFAKRNLLREKTNFVQSIEDSVTAMSDPTMDADIRRERMDSTIKTIEDHPIFDAQQKKLFIDDVREKVGWAIFRSAALDAVDVEDLESLKEAIREDRFYLGAVKKSDAIFSVESAIRDREKDTLYSSLVWESMSDDADPGALKVKIDQAGGLLSSGERNVLLRGVRAIEERREAEAHGTAIARLRRELFVNGLAASNPEAAVSKINELKTAGILDEAGAVALELAVQEESGRRTGGTRGKEYISILSAILDGGDADVLRERVDRAYESGSLSEGQTAALLRSLESSAQKERAAFREAEIEKLERALFLEGQAVKDPSAALDQVKTLREQGTLSPLEALKYETDIERANRSEVEAARSRKQEQSKFSIRLGIETGGFDSYPLEDVRDMLNIAIENGTLTGESAASLMGKWIDRRNEKREADRQKARVQTALSSGLALDPKNSEDRASVDLYWKETIAPGLADAEPVEIFKRAAVIGAETGIIPSSVLGTLRRVAVTEDESAIRTGVDAVSIFKTHAARAFAGVTGREVEYLRSLHRQVEDGVPLKEAVKLSEHILNEDKDVLERRKETARSVKTGKEIDSLIDDKTRRGALLRIPGVGLATDLVAGRPLEIPEAMKADVSARARDLIEAYGLSTNEVVDRAFDLVSHNVWSVSNIDGFGRRWMKYPPELMARSLPVETVKEQFESDLEKLDLDGTFRLESDALTKTSRSWAIYHIDSNGIEELLPQRFSITEEMIEEYRLQQEADKAEHQRAARSMLKQKRAAQKDVLEGVTGGMIPEGQGGNGRFD